MEYISVKEAAKKWGITSRMVNYYCVSGRIQGAQKIGIQGRAELINIILNKEDALPPV